MKWFNVFTKNPNFLKNDFFREMGWGEGDGARVSIFFFTKNPNKYLFIVLFSFFREGGGRGLVGWLQ